MSKSDVTGEVTYKKVVKSFIRQTKAIYKVTFEDGTILETTWNHPFRRLKLDATLLGGLQDSSNEVNRSIYISEWVEARYLKSGDLTFTANGKLQAISSVEVENREETVYNFEVEDFHTYFVGESGVWVHNQDYDDGFGMTAVAESLVKCGSLTNSCSTEIFDKYREQSKIVADGQAIGGAIGLVAGACVALCGPATLWFATSKVGQALGLSAPPALNLGYKEFISKGGNGGIAAENVVLNGSKLTLENFTIQSTMKGSDLIGPANQLLNYAKQVGANQITVRGSFSSNQLMEKFGRQVFEVTIPATKEGIISALRLMSENAK